MNVTFKCLHSVVWCWRSIAATSFFFLLFGNSLLCFAKINVSFFGTAPNFFFNRSVYVLRNQLLQFLLFAELMLFRLNGRIYNAKKPNEHCKQTPNAQYGTHLCYLLERRVNAFPFCFGFWFGTLLLTLNFPWAIFRIIFNNLNPVKIF